MLLTTKAIVFQSIRYSEADLIVKCYTESNGSKSYLLRNILKSKKGKLRASMFQPLTQLEMVVSHKNKDTLENIREAQIIYPYKSLHQHIHKSSLVMFLSEILKNAIQEEEENSSLFQFLQSSFQWLDNEENPANFHLLFLVKLTNYLGFYPNITNQEAPYFNLLDGDFQHIETNKYCISNQNSMLLKKLLETNFSALPEIKLNQSRRKSFLDMLLLYYNLHLYGFKKPKSLDILNQLF